FVPKTSFELWTSKKSSLNHFRVWGYPAEVKIYNPFEKKIDPRTTRYYFIGYPNHSKGYRFYCPNRGTRIVESLAAKFLEFDVADLDYSKLNEKNEQDKYVSIPFLVIQE